jgi:hypothetical protein
MIARGLVLALLLVGTDGPGRTPPESAADRLTLRDGQVVLGLITSQTPGPRGIVEFLVRRAWAEKNLKGQPRQWEKAAGHASRLAISERQRRLTAWRRDRAAGAAPDDRILPWIDQELARRSAPGAPAPSILLGVRLARRDVRELVSRPAGVERLLRVAWLCELPEPESMPLHELRDALEARGYVAENLFRNPPAPLDRLLPPAAEPEAAWLARRAATEVLVDSDLRFIRFQDMVMPDSGRGQAIDGLALSTALSELKRLLDLDADRPADPLATKLKALAARAKSGAAVTRLEIQPDLSTVTVEATLWVRVAAERWAAYGSRAATVRPDELRDGAGEQLADDPQVKGAFQIAEMLGLGSIPADVKKRSLRIGAATEKALGIARAAFNEDLNSLALPVLEPARDRPANPAPNPER